MKPRDQKRAEATQRNAAYAALTPTAKLAQLDQHKYAAKRQRARLAAQIDAVQNTPTPETTATKKTRRIK